METGTESGYLHPGYADALTEFGHPRPLVQSGGWILERPIPGTDARDAMGCYPLFSCRDWSLLQGDLESIGSEVVSLVLVADPFGHFSRELLSATFPDMVVPFKDHFVANLRQPGSAFVSRHHQYYARRALKAVTVEEHENPAGMLDDWSGLYDLLAERHQLTGIKAFSRGSFAKQLSVPGMTMLRATHQGQTVGAHLWYVQGEIAFSHLTASSAIGYTLMAAYALAWAAIEYFAGKVQWLDWGAGAGLNTESADGLTRYKRGWANDTRVAYLCGRIFDHASYEEISRAKGMMGNDYFPCYRKGEFG